MQSRAMSNRLQYFRRPVIAWALYDCGNSAFATSVMVGFFPLFLNTNWSSNATGAQITTRLMIANGIASLVLAVSAPLLGAIADAAARRKLFLTMCATIGTAATAGLAWVPDGEWLTAVIVFGTASVGFAGANVFYDAMLVDVTDERHFDRISAFGYALGYLGGGLLLAVHLLMVLRPGWFGLDDAAAATRAVFLTVAVWWAVFTLPLLVLVREDKSAGKPQSLRKTVSQGLARIRDTFLRIRQLKPVFVFLIAYWLYIDGVNTVMKVAIDFGYQLGIGRQHLMFGLLAVQFISFPAALLFGWLGDHIGTRRGLLAGLSVYILVTVWAALMDAVWEFYALAAAIGCVQGGVFSLSRSLYARLIPAEESAELFGFYNLVGKFAAVLGPLLVAALATAGGSTRISVAAVLPLLLLGAALLWKQSASGRAD